MQGAGPDWQDIVDRMTRQFNEIRRVTKPVRDAFDVEYVTYHRIDEQGRYVVIVDRPDYAEEYVSERIFETDPYLRLPSVYRSGSCHIPTFNSCEKVRKFLRAGEKETFLLIERGEKDVEFLGFVGGSRRPCCKTPLTEAERR